MWWMLLHWVTLESFCIGQITKELVSGPTDPRNLSVWWWWGGSVSVITLAAFFLKFWSSYKVSIFWTKSLAKRHVFAMLLLFCLGATTSADPHPLAHPQAKLSGGGPLTCPLVWANSFEVGSMLQPPWWWAKLQQTWWVGVQLPNPSYKTGRRGLGQNLEQVRLVPEPT
jgi:hypothetical protein